MNLKSISFLLLPLFFVSLMITSAQTNTNATNDAARNLSESQQQAIKRIKVDAEQRAAPAAVRACRDHQQDLRKHVGGQT